MISYLFKYLRISLIPIIKSNYRFLFVLSLGVTILASVLLVACNKVNAKTIESIIRYEKFLGEAPQIKVGDTQKEFDMDIQVNIDTNKIYVATPMSNTVSVIDSDLGTTKNIRVIHPSSIAISSLGKIYVADRDSNNVTVIDAYSDNRIKDIPVGESPVYITADPFTHKIYVANQGSNNVTVINGYSDNKIKDIPVGESPYKIETTSYRDQNKIYVANQGSNNVTVIDGHNDSRIGHDIPVGENPLDIAAYYPGYGVRVYVANAGSNSVSVINGSTDTKEGPDISVGEYPSSIAIANAMSMVYVANRNSNTVSVINGTTNTKETHDILVGEYPLDLATYSYSYPENVAAFGKIYVANGRSNTVSVIDTMTNKKDDIRVGEYPSSIAINPDNMTYVANLNSSTVSVIDASSDKTAAGIIFNVRPANSGKVICNEKEYPTNTYLYVDAGTNCIAQPNKDFEFNTWVESPLTNRNSSIPLQSTGNLTVNRYGASFKPTTQVTIPPEFLYGVVLGPTMGAILGGFFAWWIPHLMERKGKQSPK